MKTGMLILVLVLVFSLAPVPTGAAQEAPNPYVAYVKQGNIYIQHLDPLPGETPLQLTSAAAPMVSMTEAWPPEYYPQDTLLRWSPDGTKLAWVRGYGEELYAIDVNRWVESVNDPNTPDVQPTLVAQNLVTLMPPAWSDDGVHLYYAIGTGQFQEVQEMVNVYVSDMSCLSAPEGCTNITSGVVGNFWFNTGCGGTPEYPSVALIWENVGFASYPLVFDWVPTNLIVHSIGCFPAGVALLDMNTNNDYPLDESIIGVDVLETGDFLVGIVPGEDELTTTVRIMQTSPNAQPRDYQINGAMDYVSWRPDGTGFFFSLRQLEDRISIPETLQDRSVNILGVWPMEINVYFVGLHYYDLLNGTDSRLYTMSAHTLANITPVGDYVLFAQVDNSDTWYRVFEQGASAATLRMNAPHINIIRLNIRTAQVDLYLEDVGQIAVQPLP